MGHLLEIKYEKIFSPKTMATLKGKSGKSLRQMLGNKSLMQSMMKSQKLLNEIIQAEEGYRDELEMVAAQIVTDAYPVIDYNNIKIDGKIVTSPSEFKLQQPRPEEDPASPDFGEDDPEKMEAKRRIINGVTQGASIRGAFGFMLFKEYLDQIDKKLVKKYNEILKLSFGIYDNPNAIAMILSMLAQGQTGPQGGESEMEYDEDNQQFVIKARAICFPMLVHEIVKGLYEIVGTKGFGADKAKNQAIVNAIDKLEHEPEDLQYGKFIHDAIRDVYNKSEIEDPRVPELFFGSVYELPDSEFFPFVENAINDGLYEIEVLNEGQWESYSDSDRSSYVYDSEAKAKEAASILQENDPDRRKFRVVDIGLTPDQKQWAINTMKDIEKDLKKDDTGLEDLDEGKADRCLRIARRKYSKPSAYRSGAIVKCRQGKIWKGLK